MKDYINNKTIALIGNATNNVDYSQEIEEHDIIIRLNKGYIGCNERKVGKRTDMLGLSLCVAEGAIKPLNLDYLVWCTPKHQKMSQYIRETAIYYPLDYWKELSKELGTRPSTGCMMLNYLFKIGGYKSLNLYNFDFWKSNTFYTKEIRLGPHNANKEYSYLRKLMIIDRKIKWMGEYEDGR